IRNNAHKYSVSAMCDVLNIPRSTYYYHANLDNKCTLKREDEEISKEIARIFKESRNNYGTRKIKKELSKLPQPKHVSRRRDRKSTRLNSSHVSISYAVFCLKKKTQ